MDLKKSVAIVTGASSGIGEATAKLLAKKGVKVALVARSKEKLESLSRTLPGSKVFVCDMGKPVQIRSMVKNVLRHFGHIDIVINNAGRGYDAAVENINTQTFHEVFDLDVVGPLVLMQEVISPMRKQGGGSIINISSGTALMIGPGMAAYASLKRALAALSLTARAELKKDNIFVSVVYPFMTTTNFETNTIVHGTLPEWSRDDERGFALPPQDSAEYVAEKIVGAVRSQDAEVFAHDWMKQMKAG